MSKKSIKNLTPIFCKEENKETLEEKIKRLEKESFSFLIDEEGEIIIRDEKDKDFYLDVDISTKNISIEIKKLKKEEE